MSVLHSKLQVTQHGVTLLKTIHGKERKIDRLACRQKGHISHGNNIWFAFGIRLYTFYDDMAECFLSNNSFVCHFNHNSRCQIFRLFTSSSSQFQRERGKAEKAKRKGPNANVMLEKHTTIYQAYIMCTTQIDKVKMFTFSNVNCCFYQ